MPAFGALVPLLVLVAVVYAAVRLMGRARQAPHPSEPGPAPALATPPVAGEAAGDDLARWARAGLISEAQRDAILAHELARSAPVPVAHGPTTPAGRARIPAVAEALGYLGGMLAVVGLGLVVGRYWTDMATVARLALTGGTAVALVVAGALAREGQDPALARLRWSLWLGATAATAMLAGVAAVDGLDVAPETVVVMCSASVAVLSGLLWAGRDRPLQQLTFLGGIVVVAGSLVAEVTSGVPVGLTVWVVGAVLLGLGLRRMLPEPVLTEAVGTIAALVGAAIVSVDSGPGLLFVIATAFGLLAIATLPGLAPARVDRVLLGGLGLLTLAQGTPPTLRWFSDEAAGATGLAVWGAGALLVLLGARRRTLLPLQTEVLGGIGMFGGAALTWGQWHGAAPLLGIATAVGLVGLGMLPGQVLLSLLGSAGLLVNLPWAIGWFFPGEGRAPLVMVVTGALIITVAVLLTRMGGRLRHDLGSMHRRGPRGGALAGHAH